MRRNGRQAGFTLIELLVVIAIMSILTVITVSQFGIAHKRSRDVARKADLNSLSKALLNYYADYGSFPASIDWGLEFKDDTDYVYMKVAPTENTEGEDEYCYAVTTDSDKFGLFSILENEEDDEYNKYNGGVDYNPNDVNDCEGSAYNFIIVSSNAEYSDFD